MGETLWPVEGWYCVIEVSGEGIANVVVRVAILCLLVKRILRGIGQEAGLVIECVRPGVGQLRGETVPARHAQGGLKRVIDGAEVTSGLSDHAELRKLFVVWAG